MGTGPCPSRTVYTRHDGRHLVRAEADVRRLDSQLSRERGASREGFPQQRGGLGRMHPRGCDINNSDQPGRGGSAAPRGLSGGQRALPDQLAARASCTDRQTDTYILRALSLFSAQPRLRRMKTLEEVERDLERGARDAVPADGLLRGAGGAVPVRGGRCTTARCGGRSRGPWTARTTA